MNEKNSECIIKKIEEHQQKHKNILNFFDFLAL